MVMSANEKTKYKNKWQRENKINMRFAFDKETGAAILAIPEGKRTAYVTAAIREKMDREQETIKVPGRLK